MPDDQTSHHSLPYIAVSQALKEITHNEALLRIDALLHPVIESALSVPPVVVLADAGKCWLVTQDATGEWQGEDNKIAIWTGGSWRFQAATPGMRIRNRQNGTDISWSGTIWVSAPAIGDPLSGTIIDVEARAAITALLSHFRMIGELAN
ncbi:MAG: DUF2793 domain-containing protein [Sphingorhabdus sp.]